MSDPQPTSLYPALLAAMREFNPVVKNKQNPHLKNFYADLSAVLEAVTEPLANHGLLITQRFDHEQGQPILITEIIHAESGQALTSRLPIVSKDPSDPQKLGGAITYARRYSLVALLSLTAEDDDGNAASKPAPPRQQERPAPALKIPPSEANNSSGTVGQRVNVEQPRPAPASTGTPAPAANGSAGVEDILTHARILANDGMDVAGVWNHLLAQQSSLSGDDWNVVLAAWKGIKQGIVERVKKPAAYAG